MANGEKNSALSRFFLLSFFTAAFASLIVSLVAPSANASLLSATTTRTALINPSGGSDSGWSSCPADAVVVGFRWSGSTAASAPYSIYCRTLNDDGTIPADQSTAINSTQVAVYNNTSGANVSFCPAGTVATGVRHQGWSNFALICNTPPGLNQTAQYSATVSSPTDRPCAANSILMGMGKWTGAWLDSLYGVCKAYDSVTLTYNVNSGSGTAPTAVTQLSFTPFTLSSAYTGSRTGFTFAGWNTLANGSGTSYSAGAAVNFVNSTTLFAQWNSVISYDGNGNTGGTEPADTTAIGTAANTSLRTNVGTLVKTGFVFAGWNTAANGSGTSYAAGLATYTSTVSTTLYAQWNSVITYNGNGNTSGTVPAATTATRTNASTTLATNSGSLAKTGFTFGGWNTAADGSGTSYAAGATNYPANGATTLYAVWNSTANAPDLVASSDSGTSNSDNVTADQTPEFSAANLTPNATVTIELRNTSTGALVGSCTFIATATTGSCSIAPTGATPVPSGSYYARVVQTLGSSTTTSTSLNNITIDATAPTPQITTTSGTSISLRSTQNGTVTSTELGFLYLVRTSVTVTDEASITGAATDQWRRVTITSGGGNTNQALSALIGGTYRAYAVDQHGNFGGPSTNSMIIFSQASAAQNLVATPGVGSMGPKIDLSWSNPTDTENGGGITFYNVEFSTNGGTTWTTFNNKAPITSPFSIYPVNYETDYIFRISGVNLWGVGATSVVSNIANVALPNCSPTLSPNGKTYIFPVGACIWTVPAGVTSLNMDARGGQGGWGVYGYSNGGGQLTGTLTVTAGETLYIFVGDQGMQTGNVLAGYAGRPGFNGGGWGGTTTATDITNSAIIGGGGGGATDIRTTTALSSRIAIAGAAGGSAHGSGNSCCGTIGWGGAGGGTTGGITTTSDGSSGGAGTQSAGGSSFSIAGGALGIGGVGRDTGTGTTTIYGGGGGGGGYYGGGGGNSNGYGQWFTGGGGGSSFATNPRFALGANNQGVNCAPGLLALTVGSDLTQVPGFTRPCSAAADITPPVISTQTLNGDGRTLTLTYTDVNNMSGTYFDPSLFTVTSAGSNVAISSITASGKTLVLTLARNIVPGATTTISYTEPSAGDDFYTVQDTFGNDAISFTNRSIVTTGITVATPTSVDLATTSDSGTSSTDNKTNDDTPTISASSLVIGATVTFSARIGTGTPITCTIVATATTDSCTFPTLPAGVYSVTVTQTSGTTNSTASTALSVDIKTVGPTVTITNNVLTNNGTSTSTSATTFTMTFSASVTGFALADITKTGNNWTLGTLSGSGTTYTITGTNSTGASGSEGVLTFSIPSAGAVDEYGNGNVASTTFTNNWTATITYNVNGSGTAPAATAQTSSIGTISLPGSPLPAKAGHTFSGWATTSTGTTSVGPTYTPTANTTLYAIWTPAVYIISYNANGGTGNASRTTDSYTYGTTGLTLPTVGTLTRTGYTFRGWGTTTTTAVASALTSPYTPSAATTLYTIWQGNPYTVTFNKNESTATGTMTTQSITGGTPVNATANAFARVGYTFGSWNTAADGTGTSVSNSGSMTFFDNTTLYAQWIVVAPGAPTVSAISSGNTTATVTVTGVAPSGTTVGPATSFTIQAFDSTGVTPIAGKTCTVLASTSPLSCQITGLTNNTTYKFKATAINGTSSATGGASSGTATPLPFIVTYALDGGTLTPTTASYNFGTPVILPLPTKVGNDFLGWNNPSNALVGIDGVAYSPSSTITLNAQWAPYVYKVFYNGNGATSGQAPADGSFTHGSTYSIAAKGAMAKTGYRFAGWSTQSDGSGTRYANATDVIASSVATLAVNANVTLYAQWSAEVYTITYNANGGSGTPARASDSYTYGTAGVSLPPGTGLTRTGYTFGGWSESTTGNAVNNPYITSQSRTLYAQWSGIQYSITYDVNGGTGTLSDITYTTGDSGITLNNGGTLSRVGYNFGGWKTLAGVVVSGAPFTTAENVTLYAIWNAKSITVQYDQGIATAAITLPSNTSANFGSNFTLASANSIAATSIIGGDTYAFAGWNINGVTYKPGDTYRINSETPITVTSQWLRLFDVRYNLNGGSHAVGDSSTENECVTNGLCADQQPITLNSAPTRTGFTFAGWVNQVGAAITDSDGALTGLQTVLTDSNYIFYATWTPSSFTFTFSPGSGSNGNATLATASYGDTVTLPLSTGYVLAGSKFSGWLIGTTLYPAGSLYLVGADASPITATAQYVNNTFKIFYNINGGDTGLNPAPTVAQEGANITLDGATGFGRTGYTFDGWSDGTNKRAANFATTMPGQNSTVVAQWVIAAPLQPIISGVTASDSSATISLSPGLGGGAPSFYTVTASPSGATCTVISPATSCSISPLTNGTSYTFSSTATNSTGTSSATNSSAVTPAGIPLAPTGLSAVRGNQQATVSLTPLPNSATGGKAITSYTISAYDSSGNAVGTPCNVIPPASSCTVTGLTNGSLYTFKATATNGVFTSALSTASAPVVPATVPNPPTGVTATTTSPNSATVSFVPPVNNGGDPIASYTVTSSPGGFTCTVTAPATSCSFAGVLTNGQAYAFTATATNSVGTSLASSASTSITPIGPPGMPTNVTATAGDQGATISFTAPITNGSPITGYLVTALDQFGVPLNPAVTCTPAVGATTCEIISGLTNGVPYKFSVVATNAVGPSSAGITSANTIPQPRIAPSVLLNGIPAGITSVSQTLTAPQIFDGIPFPTVTYQWQRCTSPTDLTTCVNISGATASSYQLAQADVDDYIRVVATASNTVAPNLTVTSLITDQVTGIPQTPAITTGLTGNINESYSLATVAFGGATPLLYSITSGTLPTGLSFDPVTGNITGTPTAPATATITVNVVDQKGATSNITFTLTFVDPAAANQNNSTPNQQQNSGAPVTQAAAEKAAAEKAAADAAAKAASDAAAKLASDRAAAEAAARLAAEKRAAAEQAQFVAQAAAQAAAARAAAAESARRSAADAAARAAALSRSNLVSNAAKQSAAAQAAAAEARAAAAVKSAAQAASAASTANANAAAASKEVVITVGALNSAQAAAEKSAAFEAQATAARAAAKQAADSAAAQAQAERERAAAATKAAADALAAAAEKQRLAAAAQAAAQAESERLAKATAERATAKVTAEKAATEVASLLSEQAKLSEQLMNAKDPEQIAKTQAALENLNEKLELAQDLLDNAVDEVESAAQLESELTQSVNAAVSRATSATQSAKKANAQASKARTSAQTVVARALVAERAAKSANAAVKQVIAAKAKAPAPAPTQVDSKKSDAVITVGGLKPGQKIRVIVKVNVK